LSYMGISPGKRATPEGGAVGLPTDSNRAPRPRLGGSR